MITAPENWNTLWNSGARIEIRIGINLYDEVYFWIYDQDITSNGVTLQRSAYEKPSAGNAASEMIRFTMYNGDASGVVSEGPKIKFGFRLNDGETTTSWVDRGTYIISNVSNHDAVTDVTAYDEIRLLDEYVPSISGDVTIEQYADALFSNYGSSLLMDSPLLDSTLFVVNQNFYGGTIVEMAARDYVLSFDKMDGVSARDVVAGIAALLGGNAYIDSSGLLQSKSPFYNADKSQIDVTFSAGKFEKGKDYISFNNAIVTMPDGNSFVSYGGAQCEVKINPLFLPEWQEYRMFAGRIKRNLFITGLESQTYEEYGVYATGSFVTPLVELFDVVSDTTSGEKFALTEYRLNIAGNCTGELSRPLPPDSVFRKIGKFYWSRSSGYYKYDYVKSNYVQGIAFFSPISKYHGVLSIGIISGGYTVHIPGDQSLTFTASYYYKNSGEVQNNVSITVRTIDEFYDVPKSKGNIYEVVIEDYETLDIDPSRPFNISSIPIKSSASTASGRQVLDYEMLQNIQDNS